MCLRVSEMRGSGGITPADRAFLEVSFQDVTSTESFGAKIALIRSLARVCNQLDLKYRFDELKRKRDGRGLTAKMVPFQVFEVKVAPVAELTLVLPILPPDGVGCGRLGGVSGPHC